MASGDPAGGRLQPARPRSHPDGIPGGCPLRRLILFLALLLGCAHAEVRFLHTSPGPVIVLGDSLAVGVGADDPDQEGYVGLLQKRLGVPLVNKGVSGNTSADGLARLEEDVLDEKPALLILELGGNDFLRKVDKAETFRNLEAIVDRCQAREIPVLILGVQNSFLKDEAAGDFAALAERKGLGYVPNFVADVVTVPALKADNIHPNTAGYVKLADRVEPELKRMLVGVGKIRP